MSIEDGLRVFARNVLRDKFRVGQVDEEDAAALSALMDPWQAGEEVPAGAIRAHNGTVYVCIQPHVTLANWTPGATPSLWRQYRRTTSGAGGLPDEWVQPTGAHDTYQAGDEVMFEGAMYRSLADNNAHSPAAWPAGWEKVTA